MMLPEFGTKLTACAQTFRGRARISGIVGLTFFVLGRFVFVRGGRSALFSAGLKSDVCQAGRNSMLHAGLWSKVSTRFEKHSNQDNHQAIVCLPLMRVGP